MQTYIIDGLDSIILPILLVDFSPNEVILGVASSSQVSYTSYLPAQYRDFSEVLRDFLFENPLLIEGVQHCILALPEQELSLPGYPWSVNVALLEKQFSAYSFESCSREMALATLPAFSARSFWHTLISESKKRTETSFNQSIYGTVSSDYSISLIRVDPARLDFSQTQGILLNPGLVTDFSKISVSSVDSDLQHLLNQIRLQLGEAAGYVHRFFSPAGLTSWYETLYQEKGFKRQLELAQMSEPKIVQPGAPSDIAPLQLNKAPRLSIEDLQVNILSSPYAPPCGDNFSSASLSPTRLSSLPSFKGAGSYFQSLSWSTLISYINESKSQNKLGPLVVNGIAVPPEIVHLCELTVQTWLSLLADTLAQLVILLNMEGGIFLVGSFFQKLSSIFEQNHFGDLFKEKVQAANTTWNPECALVTIPCPAFPYMIHLAKLLS